MTISLSSLSVVKPQAGSHSQRPWSTRRKAGQQSTVTGPEIVSNDSDGPPRRPGYFIFHFKCFILYLNLRESIKVVPGEPRKNSCNWVNQIQNVFGTQSWAP